MSAKSEYKNRFMGNFDMKKICLIILITMIDLAVCAQLPDTYYNMGRHTSGAIDVSIVTLLTKPSEYVGKTVSVTGFLYGDYGGTYLFLTKDHAKYFDTSNAISVTSKFRGKFIPDQFQKQFVMIEGTVAYDDVIRPNEDKNKKYYIATITKIAVCPALVDVDQKPQNVLDASKTPEASPTPKAADR